MERPGIRIRGPGAGEEAGQGRTGGCWPSSGPLLLDLMSYLTVRASFTVTWAGAFLAWGNCRLFKVCARQLSNPWLARGGLPTGSPTTLPSVPTVNTRVISVGS